MVHSHKGENKHIPHYLQNNSGERTNTYQDVYKTNQGRELTLTRISELLSYNLMLNSGKKSINILTLVLSEKKFLNETKNHNPRPPPYSGERTNTYYNI
jgi:hypothetical protein